MINKKDSLHSKYVNIVEANKEKRKLNGTWNENEPEELIFDEKCKNDYDEDGRPIKYHWETTNLLSYQWVCDLFGEDFNTVNTLLSVRDADMVFVDGYLYYREYFIKNILNILQLLSKTKIVESIKKEKQYHPQTDLIVYTDKEVMQLLNIKDTTLRSYRDKGLIGYSTFNDKKWYTQSDIEKFLYNPDLRREPF